MSRKDALMPVHVSVKLQSFKKCPNKVIFPSSYFQVLKEFCSWKKRTKIQLDVFQFSILHERSLPSLLLSPVVFTNYFLLILQFPQYSIFYSAYPFKYLYNALRLIRIYLNADKQIFLLSTTFQEATQVLNTTKIEFAFSF